MIEEPDRTAAAGGRLLTARAALSVAVLLGLPVLAVLAVVDPGALVALAPESLVADSYLRARVLLVLAVAVVALPVLAAVVAGIRRRPRATGWFVVLACVALPLSYLLAQFGQDAIDRLDRARTPPAYSCVERSGGQATCPGG